VCGKKGKSRGKSEREKIFERFFPLLLMCLIRLKSFPFALVFFVHSKTFFSSLCCFKALAGCCFFISIQELNDARESALMAEKLVCAIRVRMLINTEIDFKRNFSVRLAPQASATLASPLIAFN
jgi:hypothetical protein